MTYSLIKKAQAFMSQLSNHLITWLSQVWMSCMALVTGADEERAVASLRSLDMRALDKGSLENWMAEIRDAIADAQRLQGKVSELINLHNPLTAVSDLSAPSNAATLLTDTVDEAADSAAFYELGEQVRRLQSDVESLANQLMPPTS